jgi:succinoglycan biosynthesis transport protein ExoP
MRLESSYINGFSDAALPVMRSEFQFQQLINILRRRAGMIATVAIIGTVLVCLAGLLIPPKFTAKSQIVFEPETAGLGHGREIVQTDDQGAIQTQVTALTSRAHLQHVLDSIAQDPGVHAPAQPNGDPPGIVDRLWLTLGTDLRHWTSQLITAGEQLGQIGQEPRTMSVERFERDLNVYQERGSHVIGIAVRSASPEDAARGANRIAELHYDNQYQQKRENTSRTLAWLDGRIAELKDDVERTEAAVQEYRIAHSLAEAKRTDPVDTKIADLNQKRTAAEADLAGRRARLDFVRELRRRDTGGAYLAQMLDSPALRNLVQQDSMLRQSLADQTATLGSQHPKTRAIGAQLDEVQRKIRQEAARAGDALEDEAKIADAKVRSLSDQLGTVQAAGSKAQSAEVRLHELERQATASRQLYDNLLQRREQLREQAEMIAPDVRVLSLATPPERPSSLNPILFILPAMIVSSIAGGLLAVVLERMDRGLRSERDVNETLGISCLGLVPLVRCRTGTRPHQQLHGRPFAAYTEAIRSLVAQLSLSGDRPPPKVILVTSSVPREGKTTLSVSLAAHEALLGRRVILLDLDFRHPAVMQEIGADAKAGAFDLLSQDQDNFSSASIQKISKLGLDFLPVYSGPGDPLAPFVGGQLPSLVRRLRATYDCVIIDGPPLLAVTEARLMAAMADKVLFVVKWSSTRREIAQNALNLLRAIGVIGGNTPPDGISAVVTQVDLNRHARYRYGDVGESFVTNRQYYQEGRVPAARRAMPRLNGAGGP